MQGRCISCRFFANDPALIEATFPGLNALSSAYASVRSDAGICSRHEFFLSSWQRCRDFETGDNNGSGSLLPVEKKLTGWNISLGIVLLGILMRVSYTFFPARH
jgi:hypothetical protein